MKGFWTPKQVNNYQNYLRFVPSSCLPINPGAAALGFLLEPKERLVEHFMFDAPHTTWESVKTPLLSKYRGCFTSNSL